MIEKKEEEDPDTLAMCERRIREITGKGGVPLLAKCVRSLSVLCLVHPPDRYENRYNLIIFYALFQNASYWHVKWLAHFCKCYTCNTSIARDVILTPSFVHRFGTLLPQKWDASTPLWLSHSSLLIRLLFSRLSFLFFPPCIFRLLTHSSPQTVGAAARALKQVRDRKREERSWRGGRDSRG